MRLPVPPKTKSIDRAYGEYSRQLQALNLFHGKADLRTILARSSEPEGTQMPQEDFYRQLLSLTVPLLLEKNQTNKYTIKLKTIDPSRPQSCVWIKSSYIAIRCLFENRLNSSSQRVFLLVSEKMISKNKVHKYLIGNVDLFMLNPDSIDEAKEFDLNLRTSADVSQIKPKVWLEIARHLDGGQRLNLGEILPNIKIMLPAIDGGTPHLQHYKQLTRYFYDCPNGALILKRINKTFFVVLSISFFILLA